MTFLQLKYQNKDYLLFSDLHLLHNQILEYEKLSRQKIDKFFNLNPNSLNYWLDFSNKFLDKIKNFLNLPNFKTINLGDFIFHLGPEKFEKYKNLISPWVDISNKMLIILGNHDLNKNKFLNKIQYDENGNITNLNQLKENVILFKLFNVKAFEIIKEVGILNIFTHYPISKYPIQNKFFKNLNNFLLNLIQTKYKNYKIVNYHGHTHSKSVEDSYKVDKIEYVNCCIDYLID